MAQKDSSSLALYAAAGTVAAIAVAYVASPSLFTTDEEDYAHRSSGTVGLSNPGNDCFINSVLQALAGLPELEASLARTVTDQPLIAANGEGSSSASASLEDCAVSGALLGLLHVLDERPPSRRTTTARSVLEALQHVFRTRISRQQQDAHEFLQILADRLRDEYHAFMRAREHTLSPADLPLDSSYAESQSAKDSEEFDTRSAQPSSIRDCQFPLEGATESIIQCQVCKYKPKPTAASFVVLTLNVPQKASATVDECLDGFFKVETVEDYKCQSCCLRHMLRLTEKQLQSCRDPEERSKIKDEINRLHQSLQEDPEQEVIQAPAGQPLPTSRISKHNTIAVYPSILALHFSRSIFDGFGTSRKNNAVLKFPEQLRLGGFEAKHYRLMCLITHKGGHNSGHYITFRRQRSLPDPAPSHTPRGDSSNAKMARTAADSTGTKTPTSPSRRSKRSKANKWWRISDDYVSECSTEEVLGMQRDAYITFYELDKEHCSEV